MSPFDPMQCDGMSSSEHTLLTLLLCIGTFLSYLPQHIKIISRQSSDGISPYFILLGTIGAGSNITNIILLQFLAMQCCTVQSTGTCLANLLGIFQVGIQGGMFYVTFVLYMLFFPEKNKYEQALSGEESAGETSISNPEPNSDQRAVEIAENVDNLDNEDTLLISHTSRRRVSPTLEWKTALWVASTVAVHGIICILMSTALVTIIGPYAKPTRTWASLLGLFSLCLTCLQFIPQIIKTWRARKVGALSIPMMLVQTPGGYLFAYSIAVRPGVNWSSWISTFMAATLQGILLIICLLFDAQERNERAQLTTTATIDYSPNNTTVESEIVESQEQTN